MTNSSLADAVGTIIAIHGSVVDVRFGDQLPSIHDMLRSGSHGEVIIEVAALTGPRTIRRLVFNTQHGLALGMPVSNTGGPITVPVGRSALGRLLNMFGEPIDGKPPLQDVELRSIHQSPAPLSQHTVRAEIFETGIKVIDLRGFHCQSGC